MERLDSEMHNSGNYFSDSSDTPQYESNDEDGNSNGISTQENSKSLDIQTHSLVAKLKLQLTQKNAKIQLLKGAIKQLELNLIKALQSGAGMKLEKNKLLECERTRTRYRQLQHEMASLSDQVLKLKQANERCHVNDHNLNLKVKELREELERERERAHKISVQLAACRRKEYTQKTIELENSKLNYDNSVKLDRRFQGAENSAPKPLANACCRVNLPAMHRQKKSNIIKGKTALSGRMGKNHAAKDETEAVLSSEVVYRSKVELDPPGNWELSAVHIEKQEKESVSRSSEIGRPALQSQAHEIVQLKKDLEFKLQAIKNLNVQLDRRDDEIKYLHQQLCSKNQGLLQVPRHNFDDSFSIIWVNSNAEGQSYLRHTGYDSRSQGMHKDRACENATFSRQASTEAAINHIDGLKSYTELEDNQKKMEHLLAELQTIKYENERLKGELGVFDPDFFEELEDLKQVNHELTKEHGEVMHGPDRVLDRRERRLRNRLIREYLVAWHGRPLTDATWETAHALHAQYPLFTIADDVP